MTQSLPSSDPKRSHSSGATPDHKILDFNVTACYPLLYSFYVRVPSRILKGEPNHGVN